MASAITSNSMLQRLHSGRGMLFPLAFIGLLLVLLVPVPPAVLDVLLVCSITLSIIVLLTTIYVERPMHFAVFPSLLLTVTLLRLVLNVATTRLILTATGDPRTAMHAAGEVVRTFSQFVTAGSLTVGVIIFAIIFVIQFLVITKGASRISEVEARFMLDAMPGKQMAIDADLNAGLITEVQARERRAEVTQEADFYGAMDGASKFVRGDAIAGVIITFVNILGGLYIGTMEQGRTFSESISLYTRLTIGDGLVTQLPAFIVALASGLIITRTSSRSNLADDIFGQTFGQPRAMLVAAILLIAMSFTGLPAIPLLILGGMCGGIAYVLMQREQSAKVAAEEEQSTIDPPQPMEKLLELDAIELEVGGGLIRLVDVQKGGDLLNRITEIRRQIAVELGLIVPPVRIRDNLSLETNDYVIHLKGEPIARGVTYAEQFLAVSNPDVSEKLSDAEKTTDPATLLEAFWITESQLDDARSLSYAVIDAPDVLCRHLSEIVRLHAHELLTRQAVRQLLDSLKARSPALVEEVVPSQIKPAEVQKVLQNLLRERVSIRDLETILETLGDYSSRTKDIDLLTEYARSALSRTICKPFVDDDDHLWCVTLDPTLEEMLSGTVTPQIAQKLVRQISEGLNELQGGGHPMVILCAPQIRSAVRRAIEPSLPRVAVLAYNEIPPQVAVESLNLVGLEA